MHSTVSSQPPRLDEIPRVLSDDSVFVFKEVTVSSSPTSPTKTVYAPLPLSNSHRLQNSTHSIPLGASVTSFARYSSLSRDPEKPNFSKSRSSMRRHSLLGDELLESNRESMQALSDFLMTREPPPNNWISSPSSDDDASLNGFKKSAFKLFGKGSKKKSKKPRLMQLPDSAVAARTSKGSRHIAISIPLIHDHPVSDSRPSTLTVIPKKLEDIPRERTDRSAVHVLKPLPELRESASLYVESPPDSPNKDKPKGLEINPLAVHPPTGISPQPHSPTLGSSPGTFLSHRPEPRTEPTNSYRHDPNTRKSYVAVSPHSIQRQDSTNSDPRHSGGTAYSTFPISTTTGHSRQPSSISTAPSSHAQNAVVISGLKLDLPPRSSSMSKIQPSIQEELAQSHKLLNEKALDPPIVPVEAGNASIGSSVAQKPTPRNVVVGTAETGKSYGTGKLDGPHLVRTNTPKSQNIEIPGPPNKSLPEIPIYAGKLAPRPATAPPVRAGKVAATSQITESTHGSASTRESDIAAARSINPTIPSKQSRQERVKERKQRDIDKLRSKSRQNLREPLSESNSNREPIPPIVITSASNTPQSSRVVTPPKNPRRSRASSVERRRQANSIAPIMTVADIPPYASHMPQSDLLSRRLSKNNVSGSRSTIRPIQSTSNLKSVALEVTQDNPPYSPATPNLDSFPTVPTHHSIRSYVQNSTRPHTSDSTGSPTFTESRDMSAPRDISPRLRNQSLRSSVLDTRRQERRTKRNMSLREQELDARLRRIEQDNEILLKTLGSIARSFGALGALRGHKRLSDRSGSDPDDEDSPRGWANLESEGSWIARGQDAEVGDGRGGIQDARVREVRGMEPVMRELQDIAGRVSGESSAREEHSPIHSHVQH